VKRELRLQEKERWGMAAKREKDLQKAPRKVPGDNQSGGSEAQKGTKKIKSRQERRLLHRRDKMRPGEISVG